MIPSTFLLRLGVAAWMAATAAACSVQTTGRSALRSLGQKSVGSASSQRPNAASLKMEGRLFCVVLHCLWLEKSGSTWTWIWGLTSALFLVLPSSCFCKILTALQSTTDFGLFKGTKLGFDDLWGKDEVISKVGLE